MAHRPRFIALLLAGTGRISSVVTLPGLYLTMALWDFKKNEQFQYLNILLKFIHE